MIQPTKVIFLDIDGVLNSGAWIERMQGEVTELGEPVTFQNSLDREAVKVLNKAIERTGAAVCVSSSWRLCYTMAHIRGMLNRHGFVGLVFDKTPRRTEFPCRRGNEIQDWLNEHPEVTNFVIIDDGSDMEHLLHKLVQTDFQFGLEERNLEDLVKQLNE